MSQATEEFNFNPTLAPGPTATGIEDPRGNPYFHPIDNGYFQRACCCREVGRLILCLEQ
jgi:hypothetical protein